MVRRGQCSPPAAPQPVSDRVDSLQGVAEALCARGHRPGEMAAGHALKAIPPTHRQLGQGTASAHRLRSQVSRSRLRAPINSTADHQSVWGRLREKAGLAAGNPGRPAASIQRHVFPRWWKWWKQTPGPQIAPRIPQGCPARNPVSASDPVLFLGFPHSLLRRFRVSSFQAF